MAVNELLVREPKAAPAVEEASPSGLQPLTAQRAPAGPAPADASTKIEVGYIVWSAFAVAVIVPEVLAYFGKSFTPFPGVVRTAFNLQLRRPLAAVVILAGLAILTVHPVLYSWPD
jgi:hypothetical protein